MNNYHTQKDSGSATINPQNNNILRNVAMEHQLLPNGNYVNNQPTPMQDFQGTPINHPPTPPSQPMITPQQMQQLHQQRMQQQDVIELSETKPQAPEPPRQQQIPQPKPVQSPPKKSSSNYIIFGLAFIAFILVVYPMTGKLFNKYIPSLSDTVPLKAVLMRGLLFVVIFAILYYVQKMFIKK